MYNQAGAGGAFVGWQTIPGGVTTYVPVGAGEQGMTLVVFVKRTSTTKIALNQAAKGGAFVGWQPSSARQGFATLSRGVPNAFSTSSPKPCRVGSGLGPPPGDRCAALRSAEDVRRHRRDHPPLDHREPDLGLAAHPRRARHHGPSRSPTNVTLQGTSAAVKKDTASKLKVKIPSGAKSGLITVTTPGGSVTSAKKLKVA